MNILHKIVGLFLVFSSLSIHAQDRINKNGRILANLSDLKDVSIHNLNTNTTIYSEKGGYFKIPIAVNDTIIFDAENLKKTYIIISPYDIQNRFLHIDIETNDNVLEELVINKSIANSSYLKANVRRKGLYKDLYTATSGGPISKLINLLSGRTSLIKKAIKLQEENDLANAMINSMNESYFTDELKIPKQYIGGFGYFLLDDNDVVRAVQARNEFQLQFLLPQKAEMYLETLKELMQ